MAIFRTPTDNFVSPLVIDDIRFHKTLSQEQRLANRLAKHRAATARGRNVFYLLDGTFTEKEPSSRALIAKTYYGGHDIEVTSAEVALLTAAGYGANITA